MRVGCGQRGGSSGRAGGCGVQGDRGEATPDHATIARFVADQEQALEGMFVDGLRLCAAAGLVDL